MCLFGLRQWGIFVLRTNADHRRVKFADVPRDKETINLTTDLQRSRSATDRQQRSFGIEEEYLLLDQVTGRPVNLAPELQRVGTRSGFVAEREFLSCQLETSTPICVSAQEASTTLHEFRTKMSAAAADHGVILAGVGLPPVGNETTGRVTPNDRYLQIKPMLGRAGWYHYSTGLHVHVEVPNKDIGAEVIARVARWIPALVALSANSPIWEGEPTGFASWRHLQGITWPVSGYPPFFDSAADYERTLENLIRSNIILDQGVVNWSVRLSQKFPTVEFRFADAQLNQADSVAIAIILRSLVEKTINEIIAGFTRPRLDISLVQGAIWCAARDGLSDTLIDPLEARRVPAFEFVDLMIDNIATELHIFGDFARVSQYKTDRLNDGGPACRQLKQLDSLGVDGLIDLFQSELVAP